MRRPPTRAVATARSPASHLLALQRAAGNRAVGELLAQAGQPRHEVLNVQRYEAGEHAQMGAKPGQKEEVFVIEGVRIPYGHMIALGDFYEDFDQIMKAPKEELEALVTLIDRDKKAYMKVPGYDPVSNDEWQKATEGRKHKFWRPPLYLDLAGKNDTHFAVANRQEWLKYHLQAIHLAQNGDMPRARATNAFGDHFLTDAFSAGHLVEKSKMVADVKSNMSRADPVKFAGQVADSLLANPKASAELSHYQISPAPWSRQWLEVDRTSLGDVVEFIHNHSEGKYYSMFVRAVHDKLNRDIKSGTGGVLVTNVRGKRWHLSGDETLGEPGETLAIAQEAVAQSKQNILDSEKKEEVNYDALVWQVWSYTPTPVDEGQTLVGDTEKTLTDPTKAQTPPAIAEIAIENLPMLIHELTSYHMCRRKPDVLGDYEVPELSYRPA